MRVTILPQADTSYIDKAFLADDGYVRLRPAAEWRAIDPVHLRIWCGRRARYQVVTQEMVDWLRPQVAGRNALEVGAGAGDLGHHLGIRMTDSGM
jgi:hypothetical protein